MENNKSNRLKELDALRGIAALFVVLFHLTMHKQQAKYGFKLGVTAVDIFFMISGFVIFLTLYKANNWKDFVVSRFSRLFPVYWTAVTFTAILIVIDPMDLKEAGPSFWQRYLANMTMFQLYFKQPNLDRSYWTMIVEMWFYLYMIFIFVTKKLKHIELIGAITMMPIFLYTLPFFKNEFPFIHHRLGLGFPLINHFPLFFAGIIFYKIKFDNKLRRRYLLIVLCFICQLCLYKEGGRAMYFISWQEYLTMLSCYFVGFVLFINDRLKFIINRYTLFLGNISFSLYLIHEYASLFIIMPLLIGKIGCNFWFAMIIDLTIVITIAYFITKYIEKPAMRYIRNKYKHRTFSEVKKPL